MARYFAQDLVALHVVQRFGDVRHNIRTDERRLKFRGAVQAAASQNRLIQRKLARFRVERPFGETSVDGVPGWPCFQDQLRLPMLGRAAEFFDGLANRRIVRSSKNLLRVFASENDVRALAFHKSPFERSPHGQFVV